MNAINLGSVGILHLPDQSVPLGPPSAGRSAARVGDLAKIDADAHGCPACPHVCIGPMLTGSPSVFVNGKAASRIEDNGAHATCCGSNRFTAFSGSGTVFINGKGAHRKDDDTEHCGGIGITIQGSPDVKYGGASVRKGDPRCTPHMTNWPPQSRFGR